MAKAKRNKFLGYEFAVPVFANQSVSKFWFEASEENGQFQLPVTTTVKDTLSRDEVIYVPWLSMKQFTSCGTGLVSNGLIIVAGVNWSYVIHTFQVRFNNSERLGSLIAMDGGINLGRQHMSGVGNCFSKMNDFRIMRQSRSTYERLNGSRDQEASSARGRTQYPRNRRKWFLSSGSSYGSDSLVPINRHSNLSYVIRA